MFGKLKEKTEKLLVKGPHFEVLVFHLRSPYVKSELSKKCLSVYYCKIIIVVVLCVGVGDLLHCWGSRTLCVVH